MKKQPPLKIGYSFLRYSTPEQRHGDSIRRQNEARDHWCERNGVTLDNSVKLEEHGTSAFHGEHRSNPDRYALAKFLQMVQEGRVKKGAYLIVENLDRLTREHVRAATSLVLSILDAGINIVTVQPEHIYKHDSSELTDIIMMVMELSRANQESQRKSDLVGAAWRNKKANAGKRPVTAIVPSWLKLVGNVRDTTQECKIVEVPEVAKIVKRIFRLCIDGQGTGAIRTVLNKEQVPNLSGKGIWNTGSLYRLLTNRAVIGEYQPYIGRGKKKKKSGEPIKGYYPAVISEADFHLAQEAISNRAFAGGRKHTLSRNLFVGIVKDANDGSSWTMTTATGTDRKTPRPPVLENHAGHQKGAERQTFPYPIFEKLVLTHIGKIKASDLLPKERKPEGDKLKETEGLIIGAKAKIKEIQEAMNANSEVTSLVPVLVRAEQKLKELETEYERLNLALAEPAIEALNECQKLAEMVEKEKDNLEFRARLRAHLASVVDHIAVRVEGCGNNHSKRTLFATIFFKNSFFNRYLIVDYTPGHRYQQAKTEVVAVLDGRGKM